MDLETSFLHAIAARIEQIDSVLDPCSGDRLNDVRLSPYRFERHAGTDSQRAHRALLRAGYTAHELEPIINAMPVNAAVAWSVEGRGRRWLREQAWQATDIVIAGACWSPLDELTLTASDTLRPMQATDVARLVDRLQLTSQADVVWLALASTTGWHESALGSLGAHVSCAFFQPAPAGGWMLRATAGAPGVDLDWFVAALHPDGDDRLHERAQQWFADEGRALAMSPNGLTINDIAGRAGVPLPIARAFLERTMLRETGRWAFEPDKARLIFLGP